MSAQRFHRLMSCVISWVPALPLQLAVLLFFASFVMYTEAWSAPRSKVESVANQACAQVLAAGEEQNSVEIMTVQMNEDQINELIQNLVALKQKADEARANGQGVRNNFQLMFEDLYAQAIQANPELAQRFYAEYNKSRAKMAFEQKSKSVQLNERRAQSRMLRGYQLSNNSYPQFESSQLDESVKSTQNLKINADFTVSVWRENSTGTNVQKSLVLLGRPQNLNAAIGHTNDVHAALALNENEFASAGADNRTLLWRISPQGQAQVIASLGPAGNDDPNLGHTQAVNSITLVDEHRILTTSYDRTAILWELDDNYHVRKFTRLGLVDNFDKPTEGHIRHVKRAFVVDDHRFITASGDHTAILWKIDTDGEARIVARLGTPMNHSSRRGHLTAVSRVRWIETEQGLIIQTADKDGRSFIWEPIYFEPEKPL